MKALEVRTYDDLLRERIALCDLLIGRYLRGLARDELNQARAFEDVMAAYLERAAHTEQMAGWAEKGEIGFGYRKNRCDEVVMKVEVRLPGGGWFVGVDSENSWEGVDDG